MTTIPPDLEDRIRAALRTRAAATPVGSPAPASSHAAPARSRATRTTVTLAAAAAVAAVVVAVLAVGLPDADPGTSQVRVAGRPDAPPPAPPVPAAPADPAATVPRLVLDLPDATVVHRDDRGPDGAAPHEPPGILQAFLPLDPSGRMLFLTTLRPYDPDTFGLVGPDAGEPVTVRGVTGFAASHNGAAGSVVVSAELPDGAAVYLIASGVGVDEAVAFLDGLQPRADGGWNAPVLPEGVTEAPPSAPADDGWSYEVAVDRDGDGEGDAQVNLYPDGFHSRLADRVASTTGPVERVEVAGYPAFMGPYAPGDWWVMLEPAPGRTIELRLTATRAEVLTLLPRARLVEEAAWKDWIGAR